MRDAMIICMNRALGCTVMLLTLMVGTAGQAADRRAGAMAAANYTSMEPGQDGVGGVVLDVKPGFHAQSHTPRQKNLVALTVTPDEGLAVKVGEIVYPPGKDEEYPALGPLNVYT